METSTKLHSQIAQEAGVSKEAAQAAAYLLDLSRAGKTLDQAAALMRRERADVRSIARDWSIPFPDYTPSAPLVLAWAKAAGGALEIHLEGKLCARAQRQEHASSHEAWEARWMRGGAPIRPVRQASTVMAAARQLSIEVERQSVTLLGVDDVAITFPDNSGGGGQLFHPKRLGDPRKLRSSLQGAG